MKYQPPTGKPIRPNLGIAAEYERRLAKLIRAMGADVKATLTAAYQFNEPEIAQDASPAKELEAAVKRLARKWSKNFDKAADDLAEYFAKAINNRSDAALRSILRKHGISVKFKMTAAMNDVRQATIAANVALIKSIPMQYHNLVQGSVMRSVQAGRDLHTLTRELESNYDITYKRAKLIARDQNNKATSALTSARQRSLGFKRGIWLHSHGDKVPRRTHLAMHGKPFDLSKGMYDKDEGEWVMPGYLINCTCVWKPILEGFG